MHDNLVRLIAAYESIICYASQFSVLLLCAYFIVHVEVTFCGNVTKLVRVQRSNVFICLKKN